MVTLRRLPHGVYTQLLLLFIVIFLIVLSCLLTSVISHNITLLRPLTQTTSQFVIPAEEPISTPDLPLHIGPPTIVGSNSIPKVELRLVEADNHPCGQDPASETDLQVGTVLHHTPPSSSSTDATNLTNSTALLQQMTRKARATIAILSSLIAYVSINSLVRAINPNAFVWCAEDREEPRWIASSQSWLDRKACRWFGLCGAAHFHLVGAKFGRRPRVNTAELPREEETPWRSFWTSGADAWDQLDKAERARREVPDYVFEYAPLVHLSSGEQFWPSDIAEHLYHTTPTLNYTPIQSKFDHPTLSDLDKLNQWQEGWNVFLTSDDNVEERPEWLEGEKNIPESGDIIEEPWADWDGRVDGDLPGDTAEEQVKWAEADIDHPENPKKTDQNPIEEADKLFQEELRKRYGGQKVLTSSKNGGRSDAPAVLLVVDKGNGIVDAFWFYFYSFNLGNVVFNVRFGNHVGDWEHCLVRFYHGKPKALFFSAHSAGEAYSYEAVEKIGKRVS